MTNRALQPSRLNRRLLDLWDVGRDEDGQPLTTACIAKKVGLPEGEVERRLRTLREARRVREGRS